MRFFRRPEPPVRRRTALAEINERLGWRWNDELRCLVCTHCGTFYAEQHAADCVWLDGSPYAREFQ